MLRCYLLFLVLAPAWSWAQGEPVLLDGPPRSRLTAPGAYDLEISTRVLRPLSVATVPVPTTYLRFVAPLRVDGLLEDNLLDSLYQVDINGNRILDEVSVRVREGGLRLDMMPVETMSDSQWGDQRPYREDGSLKRYFLDPDCPEFVVDFYQPPLFGLDLQHRGYRPDVQELPNPCLQVMVYEPCVGPSGPNDLPGEPTFQLSFPGTAPDQNLMFVWQPELLAQLGQGAQWMRVKSFCFPLSAQPGEQVNKFHLECGNDSNPVGMWVQLNYALEGGVRKRGKPVVQTVYPGWKQ